MLQHSRSLSEGWFKFGVDATKVREAGEGLDIVCVMFIDILNGSSEKKFKIK